MKWKQQARVLMRKAAEDEFILAKLLPDPASPDSGGFHAQQAAEKLLKAVLNIRQVSYRRTHEIAELLDLLERAGVKLPDGLHELKRLTPFAVEYRYDDPGELSSDPVDRQWVRDVIQHAHKWADAIVSN